MAQREGPYDIFFGERERERKIQEAIKLLKSREKLIYWEKMTKRKIELKESFGEEPYDELFEENLETNLRLIEEVKDKSTEQLEAFFKSADSNDAIQRIRHHLKHADLLGQLKGMTDEEIADVVKNQFCDQHARLMHELSELSEQLSEQVRNADDEKINDILAKRHAIQEKVLQFY